MAFGSVKIDGQISLVYIDRDKEVAYVMDDFFEQQSMVPIRNMNRFIQLYQVQWWEEIKEFFREKTSQGLPIDSLCLTAPIPEPMRNIVCLGKNYLDHIKEITSMGIGSDTPSAPIYFTKATHTVIGPSEKILSHEKITQKLDYEAELAVIIGKKGIDIKQEEAESYIFGYTIANDISARDLQQNHMQWYKGKSLVTHCPTGPWIVPKESLPYPPYLPIRAYVNDELRQQSNTDQLLFGVSDIICDLSKGYELRPGDIILTGTPSGVGQGFSPPKYLKRGDVVTCIIDGIGSLSNPVE